MMNEDQIEGLRAATKIVSATLKHALDNTKVKERSADQRDVDWNVSG